MTTKMYSMEFDDSNHVTYRYKFPYRKIFSILLFVLTIMIFGFVLGYLFQPKESGKLLQALISGGVGDSGTVPDNETLSTTRIKQSVQSEDLLLKRDFIRKITINAWNTYEKNAWGYDSVKPVTLEPSGQLNGATIISSMSTLFVMDLKDEFDRGRKWIQQNLNLTNQSMVVSHTVSNYVGGLLSCYALTHDQFFLDKAITIARILEVGYETRTGLPKRTIDSKNSNFNRIKLSDIGDQQLEYIYLTNMTQNDPEFRNRIESIWNFIRTVDKPKGLYMYELDVVSGAWTKPISTLWGASGKLYTNLVKSYIQSGKGRNCEPIETFVNAIDAVNRNGMIAENHSGYYARNYDSGRVVQDETMASTACYLGAMFALGAESLNRTLNGSICESVKSMKRLDYWKIGKGFTKTCHKASVGTKTGLTPWLIQMSNSNKSDQGDFKYSFSPQLAESYFILWRLTHEQKYRDNAWAMVQSIHQHCRTESGGYSSIENVNQVPTVPTNYQPPHFLSATLKYLYLTFTDDSVLPLSQWVFNSAGHPLPICGTSDAYPAETCKWIWL